MFHFLFSALLSHLLNQELFHKISLSLLRQSDTESVRRTNTSEGGQSAAVDTQALQTSSAQAAVSGQKKGCGCS